MIDPDALSPEKRAQILAGAAVVFAEDGFEGSSMSRIAKQANVSKGTLYNHFDSKAALFKACVRGACTRHLSPLFAQLNQDDDLGQSLHEIGLRMVTLLMSHEARTIYRMVVSEAVAFPELAVAYYENGPAVALAAMARWIADQVGLGRLQVADPWFAAEQFFSLCQTRIWMRSKLQMAPEPTPAETLMVVENAVQTFLARYHTSVHQK